MNLGWRPTVGILESRSLFVMSALDDYSYTISRAIEVCRASGGLLVYHTNPPRSRKELWLVYEFPDRSQLKLYSNGYSCSAKRLSYQPLNRCCWLHPGPWPFNEKRRQNDREY